MGLYVIAYRGLRKLGPKTALADIHFYATQDFPERAEGLDFECAYVASSTFEFGVGSYSVYGKWRNGLACLGGWASDAAVFRADAVGKTGPFLELISFSDCEGAIGPVAAARLAKDFADFQTDADQRGRYFVEIYANFRKAFEMAADNGAVSFH